jgi:Flp pilus assembly protein TadG
VSIRRGGSPLLRLRNEDDGVTLVIVVLTLIAMMGMLVLVVDVGGLLWKRRELVNASDAAALSAAHTCALKSAVDPKTAKQAADFTALTNVTGPGLSGIVTDSGTCHTGASGWVKVQYSQPQHLFFAPVLGFSNSNGVTTKATAVWGPAGAANPVPLVIYMNSFNNCKLQDPTPEPTCYVWEDNTNTSGSQNGFGFLDLRTDNPSQYGWDSVAGAPCSNAGSDVKRWIEDYPDSNIGDLPLNYPAATYVCLISGGRSAAWGNDAQKDGPIYDLVDDDDVADQNDAEDILLFPLNRCDTNSPASFGQLDSGSPISCPNTPDQYDIVGFVAMKIKAIYTPNEASGSQGTCKPNNASVTMINGSTVSLSAFGISNGCFTTAPSAYSNVKVTKKQNGQPGPQPVFCPGAATATCDYTVSTSGLLTWNAAGPAAENQPYDIAFDWVLYGPCGPAPGNNSGHCMVVQVTNVQVGGTNPGQGDPNSNLRAVKLCDPSIAGSCGSISVPNP